ncbi:DUF5706 domain-containing protein [Flavobacteriaceae bacterium KMM 6897]|nr:DUF5706 domain-containing protein [Flavobacteriaceae bacterium KMM 6897]MEB8345117.1 DUF5706 domain-containing protein [Flavobacteriaceae bacterium KMM 6898]
MKKLSPEDKINVYWHGISYINGLNRSSEIKAGLIISFYGLLLGVVFKIATGMESNLHLNMLLSATFMVFIFFVSRSIYFSFKCFMPHIETKFNSNMFFFHDVVTKYGSIQEYSKKLMDLMDDEHQLYDQLGEQIFVNSLIASKKFTDVNKSVKNLVYSFIPLLVSVILLLAQVFL